MPPTVHLLGAWYRPPYYGETDSIYTLESEWSALEKDAVGTIIAGDMNVHHKQWLKYSTGTSVEGRALSDVTCRMGLAQKVTRLTRG